MLVRYGLLVTLLCWQPYALSQAKDSEIVHEELFNRLDDIANIVTNLQNELQRSGSTEYRGSIEQQLADLEQRLRALEDTATAPFKVDSNAVAPLRSGDSDTDARQYRQAYALIESQKYTQALEMMRQYVNDFAYGIHAAEAWYWMGELFLAQNPPNYNEAISAFSNVSERFAIHPKTANALYKLGTAYHRKGALKEASETLRYVQKTYRQSKPPIAELAELYLRNNNL